MPIFRWFRASTSGHGKNQAGRMEIISLEERFSLHPPKRTFSQRENIAFARKTDSTDSEANLPRERNEGNDRKCQKHRSKRKKERKEVRKQRIQRCTICGETRNHKTIKDVASPRVGISRCWTVKMKRSQFCSSIALLGLAVCLVPQWGLVASKAVSPSEPESQQAQRANPDAFRSSKAKVGLAKAAVDLPAESE